MTYHLLSIGVTALIIYLFTLFLSSSGFTGPQSHRRFWNWVLLLSFLLVALFGLFTALKVNYRWEFTFSDSLLHWHVEAGIAMIFAAIIHLTWHLTYYTTKSGNREYELPVYSAPDNEPADPRSFRSLLLLIGFISSASQFILIREAAILGGGTEATAALFLWLWLMIAATGAVSGSRSAVTSMRKMVWSLIAVTIAAPLLFIIMNSIILGQGQTPSFFHILLILAVSVAPVTFLSALIFVRISVIRHSVGLSLPGNSFGAETAGSVTAGIITALTVPLKIPNYQLYLLIILVSVIYAVWFLGYGKRRRTVAIVLSLMLAATLFVFPPDTLIRSMLLRGVRVTKSIDTAYGNIAIGIYDDEETIYYDHRPLFYPGDIITAEENIHYALLQRHSYDKVLLVSGGMRKHLPELAKYSVSELTYLEMDPGLIAVEQSVDTLCGSMAVRVVRSDPMQFFRESSEEYDAIIQLVPPPSTLSVNRFYTTEYFMMVKDHLTAEGVFMCTPMVWFNYSPESYRRGFSPLYNALASTFRHISLVPGSYLYTIASDSPVSGSIVRLTEERGISGFYVNSDYLDDGDLRTKSEQILSQVDRTAEMNRALRPVTSLFANLLSLERMGMGGDMIFVVILLMFLPFLYFRKGAALMFTSSASLAGFGMIMIFILQMTVGNIYILTAVILTLLMAGLAAGSVFGNRLALKSLPLCAALLIIIFIITGVLAPMLVTSAPTPVLITIFTLLPAAGIITGAVYRILTGKGPGGMTGTIYAADLAGSALGYLTVATLLVPLAGIAKACFFLALFILLSLLFASKRIKE